MENVETEPIGFDDNSLTLVEHYLIGSVPLVHGQAMKIRPLLENVVQGDKDARRRILTPVAMWESATPLAVVNQERWFASLAKITKGVLPIFTDEHVALALNEGIEPYVEIRLIDKAGLGPEEWRIWLVDRNNLIIPNPDKGAWEKIKLTPEAILLFNLEEPNKGGYRMLRLKA